MALNVFEFELERSNLKLLTLQSLHKRAKLGHILVLSNRKPHTGSKNGTIIFEIE